MFDDLPAAINHKVMLQLDKPIECIDTQMTASQFIMYCT